MGISIWQLLIVLAIVVVLFGTKKLRNMGGDLGAAIRNFKNAVNEGENEKQGEAEKLEQKGNVIEGEATREKDKDKV
jgi:sec-independent protein translocase protein TatA